MERWHFKCLFGWEGMREKKVVRPGCFLPPGSSKMFSPKNGEKIGERGGGELNLSLSKCSCAPCTWALFLPFVCFLFSFLAVVLDSFIYLFIFWTLFLPFFFFLFSLFLFFFFYFFVFGFFLYFSIVFLFFIFYVLIFLWLVLFKKKKKL